MLSIIYVSICWSKKILTPGNKRLLTAFNLQGPSVNHLQHPDGPGSSQEGDVGGEGERAEGGGLSVDWAQVGQGGPGMKIKIVLLAANMQPCVFLVTSRFLISCISVKIINCVG